MLDEKLSSVIGAIYDCPANGSWDEATRQLARFVGADVIHLMLGAPANPLIDSAPDADPQVGPDYRQHFLQTDKRRHRMQLIETGTLFLERTLLSENEHKESAVHQDLFRKYGIFDLHSAVFDINGCHGWIGFSVSSKKQQFEEQNLARMRFLVPHIGQAFRLALAFRDQRLENNLLLHSFDHETRAHVLVNTENGKCLLNAAARQLAETGLFWVAPDGIRFRDHKVNEAIGVFGQSEDPGVRADFTVYDPDGSAYQIRATKTEVRRPGPEIGFQGCLSFVFHKDPPSAEIAFEKIARFSDAHGLSRAEREVIWFILNLKTLRAFAAHRGIRIDTARKQLKSAFRKLDVNSQKALLRKFDTHPGK